MANSISVDITPDKSLIQKLGLVGYRTEQAIAELVDNSIDARLPDQEERIQVHLDFEKKWIGVKDDGYGMDKDELANAMTIAKGTKSDDKLGRFGIGMKSACSALGKKFTITTSKIDSNKEYSAEYDEKLWLTDVSLNWKNFKIGERTLADDERWHGTRITISELNVPLYPNQVSNFKEHFGIRYSPYLQSKQVSIQINTVMCRPENQDLEEDSKTNIKIKLQSGREINGFVALLKKRSIRGHYGIHLFRNKRLIKAFAKFGFASHPENAKIIGELYMNHVPVNFNKSEFIEDSTEYEEVRDAFIASKEFKQIKQKSQSKERTVASIESLFGYFNKRSPPQYLERNVRSKVSRELLNNTKHFEIKTDRGVIGIDIKSLKDKPLYVIKKEDDRIKVIINRDNNAFRFVKNPLFLIGIIASEVKLITQSSNADEFIQKRNGMLEEFLNEWSKKPEPIETFRDRKIQIPRIPHYKIDDELVDVHEYLKENYQFKFQFTALSTLASYLHNLRGKLVYTIHTEPEKGEYVVDLLSKAFGDKFAVANNPDIDTLTILLRMPSVNRIIAVREYSVIKGSTIAMPEKAFVDLIIETHTNDIPLDDLDLERIFKTMLRYSLIDNEELRKYANFVKKTAQLEKIVEAVA